MHIYFLFPTIVRILVELNKIYNMEQLIKTLNECFGPSSTDYSFNETQLRLCNAIERLTYQLELQNQIISDYLIHNMENYIELRNNGATDIENSIVKLKKLKNDN